MEHTCQRCQADISRTGCNRRVVWTELYFSIFYRIIPLGFVNLGGKCISGLSAGALALIAAAVLAVVSAVVFLKEHWDEVTAAVRRFWQENIVPKLESIRESFEKIKTALQPVIDIFKKIGDALKPAIDAIGEFISKIDILGFVGKVFEGIGFVVVEVVGGLIAGAFQAVMGIIDGFIQTIAGLVEIVSGFSSFFNNEN